MGYTKRARANSGTDKGIENIERIEATGIGTNDESGIGSSSGDTGRGNSGERSGISGPGDGDQSRGSSGASGRDGNSGSGESGGQGSEENNSSVNPSEIAGETARYQTDNQGRVIYNKDGSPAKKRGRKPGQSPKVETAAPKAERKIAANGTEMLAAQFQLLNMGIAYLTNFDEFKLSDTEAMQMSKATANVMEQFDYVPDPKITAVLGLVTCTSMIYGPRIYLYRKELDRRASEKVAKVNQVADENIVTDIYAPSMSGASFQ